MEKKQLLHDLRMNTTLVQCNKEVKELLQKELTDHGLKVLLDAAKSERRTSKLIDNIVTLLKVQNRFNEAQILFEERFVEFKKVNGPNDQETLSSMYQLGNLL